MASVSAQESSQCLPQLIHRKHRYVSAFTGNRNSSMAGNSYRGISLGMDNIGMRDVDYAASMLEAAINKIRTEQASRAPRLEGRVADMAGGKEA